MKLWAFLIDASESKLDHSPHTAYIHRVIQLIHDFILDEAVLKTQLLVIFQILQLKFDLLQRLLSEDGVVLAIHLIGLGQFLVVLCKLTLVSVHSVLS